MIKINLEIDEVVNVYYLPENWSEVSIKDFVSIFNINREGLTDVQLMVKIINILTKIEEDEIYLMHVSDFTTLNNVLKFLTTDLVVENDIDYIEIDDVKYYLKKDFSQLTMGEVISIDTLLSSADGNLFKVMDKLLCVFLRKKKENGSLEPFKPELMERAKLFEKTPISKVYNLFSFFLDGGTISANNTNPSSVKSKRKKQRNKVNLTK